VKPNETKQKCELVCAELGSVVQSSGWLIHFVSDIFVCHQFLEAEKKYDIYATSDQ
jgi:hypothetical protein